MTQPTDLLEDPSQAPQFRIHRRVIAGAMSNWIGQLVVLGTAFLLTPFILHQIGATTYGLWVLATSLTSYGSLLNLGITSAIVKYVAEHKALGAMDEASRLVSSAMIVYALLALVAVGMAGGLAPFVPQLFHIASEKHELAVWLTLLIGVQVGIALPTSVPGAVLRGLERFDLSNAILVAATLLSAGATVVALILGGGIVALVAVSIVTTLVVQLPTLWLVRREAPTLRFHPRLDTRRIRSIFRFSISVFGVRAAGVLNTRTDAIVIGAALPVGMVTPYALGQRLTELVSILTNQFTQVILPVASELDARRDIRALRAVYLTATRISLAIAVPLAVTVVILGPSILRAWVGAEYSRYGNLVTLLALAALIDIVVWAGGFVLTGMTKHPPLAWMAIGASIVNVLLSIALVRPFGLTGVATATLVASTAQTVVLVLPYTMRVIGVRPLEVLRDAIAPNLLPGAVMILALVGAREVLDASSLGTLIAVALIGFAVYLLAYLKFGASPIERAFYRDARVSAFATVRRKATVQARRRMR